LNDVVQRAGVVSFHGPMVSWLAENPDGTAALLATLRGEALPAIAAESWRDGDGEGMLVGGCLSIVAAMLGTPYALDTRGRILFLEDVNERPFRIDRMLIQLRQAGTFEELRGLVFGEMPSCFDGEEVCLEDIVGDVCAAGDYPILAGVPSGHGRGALTLPLGVRARLRGGELTFLEPAVSAA
jgi:muramoyltetrapeptide carboxypeptidase